MALIACRECSKQYSDSASACPQCGARVKKRRLWIWIPLSIPIAFILFAVLRTRAPDEDEKIRARDAIDLCWSKQKTKSFDPSTAQFVARACETMEEDFKTKYHVAP
ncbi:hypothetical protein [Janthinobacterium sp. HLS12-2]|uniref:hypothetical protein n=1 Tax=Janthinobacterium sp. HLS12-2 TaxID=1259324 RepID=UPI003F272330